MIYCEYKALWCLCADCASSLQTDLGTESSLKIYILVLGSLLALECLNITSQAHDHLRAIINQQERLYLHYTEPLVVDLLRWIPPVLWGNPCSSGLIFGGEISSKKYEKYVLAIARVDFFREKRELGRYDLWVWNEKSKPCARSENSLTNKKRCYIIASQRVSVTESP